MITVTNAITYSINGATEVAFQIDYSDGTQVRAVKSANSIIRKEYKKAGEWMPSGKPYVVAANRKRLAERMVETVKAFLQ